MLRKCHSYLFQCLAADMLQKPCRDGGGYMQVSLASSLGAWKVVSQPNVTTTTILAKHKDLQKS